MNSGERISERIKGMENTEAEGRVADSLKVRMALIERFRSGELSFDQMQYELQRIKRDANKNGLITRSQAYKGA